MKLLHLDASALGTQSVTRELSAAIVATWRTTHPNLEVTYRDLDANPLPHLTSASLAGGDAALAAQVLQEFVDADVVVVGAPMYNFTIPSTLKSWLDRVAVAGTTFRYTESGPQGLMLGKTVVVASGRGGVHSESPVDFQEPYLRQMFAFLGITHVDIVRAEGVAYSAQHRADAIAAAKTSIPLPHSLSALAA